MIENLALYSRIGYAEYDRRSRGEFTLVYMRTRLHAEAIGLKEPSASSQGFDSQRPRRGPLTIGMLRMSVGPASPVLPRVAPGQR
jgi:hypothetical protein